MTQCHLAFLWYLAKVVLQRSALSRACLIFAIEFSCPAQTDVDCSLGQFYKRALLQNVEDCYF